LPEPLRPGAVAGIESLSMSAAISKGNIFPMHSFIKMLIARQERRQRRRDRLALILTGPLAFVIILAGVAIAAYAFGAPAISSAEPPRTPIECTAAGGSIVYTHAMLPNFGGPAPDGSVREQIVGWKCEFSEKAVAQQAGKLRR
jgi:hypothetical protein